MNKVATVKKLVCPASNKVAVKEENGKVTEWKIRKCDYSVDLVKVEALEAQGQLLIHLRDFHNFYWKRHGKKLVTRFSKQYAMRNK